MTTPGLERVEAVGVRVAVKRTYRYESGDLLSVLNQLHTDTLPDSRVRLLGLDTDFLEDNALSVRGASGGGGLVNVTEGPLLVCKIRLMPSKEYI